MQNTIAKYAVDANLLRLGSTNPKKRYPARPPPKKIELFFFFKTVSIFEQKKNLIFFFKSVQIYMKDAESADLNFL